MFAGSLLLVSSVRDLTAGNDAFLRRVMYDIVPAGSYVWNWRDAVVIRGLIEVYDTDPELRGEVLDYVREAMLTTARKAHGHHPNGVASGAGLAFLIRAGEDRDGYFMSVADRVFEQYRNIPRAENGACSHRPKVVELWDDTVYMLTIFLVEMYRATGDDMYLDMCADEMLAHAEKLMDPGTGLWYHGWAQTREIHRDACCQDGWNDNPLQRNGEFWGRGNGWIAMSLVDLLAVMPETHEDYPGLSGNHGNDEKDDVDPCPAAGQTDRALVSAPSSCRRCGQGQFHRKFLHCHVRICTVEGCKERLAPRKEVREVR